MTGHSKNKRVSQSNREAIIRAYTLEVGWKSVALALNVPIDTARRLINRFERTGLTASHDCGGRRHHKMTSAMKEELKKLAMEHTDWTLEEFATALAQPPNDFPLVHGSTISKHLKAMMFTVKNSHSKKKSAWRSN